MLAVPMMIEIFQERVKMVSAGNGKQKISVTIVGTLRGQSVSQPARVSDILAYHAVAGGSVSNLMVGNGWRTYNNQMTLDPVLQPLRVTM